MERMWRVAGAQAAGKKIVNTGWKYDESAVGDELFGWGLQEKIHVDDRAVIVNLAGTHGTAVLDPGGENLYSYMNFEVGY
jgi:hypothetical protein